MTALSITDTPRGRTQISSRAMTRVVTIVAAEILGVKPGSVSVDFADTAGSLDVTVRTTLPRSPITGSPARAAEEGSNAAGDEQSQQHIRGTVRELTGARINAVTVRFSTPRIRLPRLAD